jgi:pimeloyl-ACP methyl ester carboxylesterase
MRSGENRGIKELWTGTGYGPRAALIHGGADTWRTWCPLLRHLDYSWQVLAFDLPWRTHGHRGLRRAGTPGGWVTDFVTTLGQDLDLIVGHSLSTNALLEALAWKPSFPLRTTVLVAPSKNAPYPRRPTWSTA